MDNGNEIDTMKQVPFSNHARQQRKAKSIFVQQSVINHKKPLWQLNFASFDESRQI